MKGITSLIFILLFNTICSNYIDTFFSYKLTGRHLSLRELLDEGIKKKVCSNMGDYKDINKTSFGDYVTEMNFKENGARKLVVGMLTKGTVTDYNDAIKDVVVWVFMIALAIIILITWPLFICCCLLGCCCFNKNVKAGCVDLFITVLQWDYILELLFRLLLDLPVRIRLCIRLMGRLVH